MDGRPGMPPNDYGAMHYAALLAFRQSIWLECHAARAEKQKHHHLIGDHRNSLISLQACMTLL